MENKTEELRDEFLKHQMEATGPHQEIPAFSSRLLIVTFAIAWAVYDPLASVLGFKSSGAQDEIIALGVAVSFLIGSRIFRQACALDVTFKESQKAGWIFGGLSGTMFTATVFGGFIAATTVAVSAPVFVVVVVGGGLVGAFGGGVVAGLNAKKFCPADHLGKCCERICMTCGLLYYPDEKWKDVVDGDEAKKASGDRLTWMDVASIFQFRGLSYPESVFIIQNNIDAWGMDDADKSREPTVSRDIFFEWFEQNEGHLSNYYGKKPDLDIWRVAEPAVRSECSPLVSIKLDDIGSPHNR